MNKGKTLLKLARASIAGQLGVAFDFQLPNETWLEEPHASFVTLHKNGALRGCIGSLSAHRSLAEDVAANAVAAAFHDPRFAPLSVNEFDALDIEVSLLSRPEKLLFTSESELISLLRPHIDGLILSCGANRGTFLPQVWGQLPEPAQFIAHLKQKTGLPADFWSHDIEIERYSVEAFCEKTAANTP